MPKFFALKRRPMAVWADALTITRGIGIPVVLVVLILLKIKSSETLLSLLALGWITDWYDGMLARKAGQSSWIGEIEVVFDLFPAMAASVYLLILFDLPLSIYWLLLSVLILCVLALYGAKRHKATSFVVFIELLSAPAITGGLGAHAIFFGNLNTKLIAVSFAILALFHLKIGFNARKRVIELIAPLKEDLARAIGGAIRVFKKRS